MSKQSRSRRNQPETLQTNWSLPSTAPLTPAPQPTVARAVQPATAAPEQTASEPALEELRPAPLGHHLGGFSIFPESSTASAPPPSAPSTPPADGGLPTVQASLRVNTPGDVYEQEADLRGQGSHACCRRQDYARGEDPDRSGRRPREPNRASLRGHQRDEPGYADS